MLAVSMHVVCLQMHQMTIGSQYGIFCVHILQHLHAVTEMERKPRWVYLPSAGSCPAMMGRSCSGKVDLNIATVIGVTRTVTLPQRLWTLN